MVLIKISVLYDILEGEEWHPLAAWLPHGLLYDGPETLLLQVVNYDSEAKLTQNQIRKSLEFCKPF